MTTKAWEQEQSWGDKLRNFLCHHDWHFILCFIILVFVFIFSILVFSECDMREHLLQMDKIHQNKNKDIYKDFSENTDDNDEENEREKTTQSQFMRTSISTKSSTFMSSIVPFTQTLNPSHTTTTTTTTTTTKGTSQTSLTNQQVDEFTLTTRGWIFPNQLRKDAAGSSLIKNIVTEEDNLKCSFLVVFIVLSAIGLLLLLFLWCLVILHC